MDRTEESFSILGIEPTKDENSVKKAYRQKLHSVNPEDDPEGFKALREAYEKALEYTKQKEEKTRKKKTPVEQFIDRCAVLYGNFYQRIRKENWEALFDEDICVSLETGEKIREAFLVFLMDHFRFPSSVWKLIDHTFSISGNREELLELFPEDYVDFLLQVVRYNGALNYELFTGEADDTVDEYIEHYHRLRQYTDLGMSKEAWEEYSILSENYSMSHPYVLLEKARLLYSEGKKEEAGEIFHSLAVEYDSEERIVCCYGRFLEEQNEWEKLSHLYDKVLEKDPASFLARTGKMETDLHDGYYRKAREEVLDLLEESPVDERLIDDLTKCNVYIMDELEPKYQAGILNQDSLMELAWCYYQNSRFEDGIALLDSFAPDEEHILDYHNLKGRIFLTINKEEEALGHLTIWLSEIRQLRPDGTKKTARRLARLGYAYYTIGSAKATIILRKKEGDLTEAMEYINRAVEEEKDVYQKVSYYHTAADIWRQKKDFARVFDYCDKMLVLDPQYYPAYVLREESCLYLGRFQDVIYDYHRAVALYPYYGKPYSILIRMLLCAGEYDQIEDILKLTEENKIESDELRFLRAKYITVTAKNKNDYKQAITILNELEKKGWSLQSEMDEEEWKEIVRYKKKIEKIIQEGETT